MEIHNQIIVVAFNSIDELRELAVFPQEEKEAAQRYYETCQKYDAAMIYPAHLFGKAFLVGHFANEALNPNYSPINADSK